MDRIKAFKPNKKKLIISIIATVIWYAILYMSLPPAICSPCPPEISCPVRVPRILNKCDCCFDLSDLTGQILYAILLPFAVVYAIISLYELSASVRKAYGKG